MKKEDGFATTLVPVDKIRPPLFQCRTQTLDENLDELVDSIKTVGLLEPLVIRIDKEQQPELVVGSRRLKACMKAGLEMVPVVVRSLSDEEALEIEGSENLNRNDLSPEEKTRLCVEWAKRGYDANAISGKVHKSYSWVASFLPHEFKDKAKVEAGKLGGEARSASIIVAKSQDLRQLQVCDRCKMPSRDVSVWHGRLNLCSGCTAKADFAPESFEHIAAVKNGQAKLAKVGPQPMEKPKPLDSWEHRSATMKVQHSQQEGDLLKELVGLGITPQTDREVSLKWTVPDGLYEKEKVCYYVHGPPHDKGKAMDRDDEIEAALKQLGWDVLVFRHGTGSVKEWAQEVKEALKF